MLFTKGKNIHYPSSPTLVRMSMHAFISTPIERERKELRFRHARKICPRLISKEWQSGEKWTAQGMKTSRVGRPPWYLRASICIIERLAPISYSQWWAAHSHWPRVSRESSEEHIISGLSAVI